MIGKNKFTGRERDILNIVRKEGSAAISTIESLLSGPISRPTLNRDLRKLVEDGWLLRSGTGKATRYAPSDQYVLHEPIPLDEYFALDPDHRNGQRSFNFEVIDLLRTNELFEPAEVQLLDALRKKYQANITDIPPTLYKKELERLTIELSWKSGQIEGNTYSLLETERLLADQEEATGKAREEAVMLLNHKITFEYLLQQGSSEGELTLRSVEEVHSMLMNDLPVGRNIRTHGVGITGSAYRPLDNDHQIREQVERMCELVNGIQNGYAKALLAILLISYIQPFEDGNKRTARLIGNALLMQHGACPLSYRSVDPIHYKEAMLLFYEQNNVSAFKELFLEQVRFAVENYFR